MDFRETVYGIPLIIDNFPSKEGLFSVPKEFPWMDGMIHNIKMIDELYKNKPALILSV